MQAKIWNHSQWITETNPSKLKKYFKKLLIMSGFNILKISQHHFNPYGYTALFLLSESHFAIHTFPEENKTYIELSSCVKRQYDLFLKQLNNN